jgi:hypothetical protein
MSDISNKKPTITPFRHQDTPQSVGSNYGERMKFNRLQEPRSAPAQAPSRSISDQFNRDKKVDASQFGPHATYKAMRRQTVDGCKPVMLQYFEDGKIPQTGSGMPSDPALLNFLDQVRNNSAPIQSKGNVAAKTMPNKSKFIRSAG